MVGSVLFLLATGSDLAQLMLLILPPTGIIIFFFIRKAQPVFLKVQERLDTLNQILQEDLTGIRVVKAFVRSGYEVQRFDNANVELTQESIRVQKILALIFPTILLIINLGVALVLWVGGLRVIEGGQTVGGILAFISYLLTALFPIALLAIFSGQISAAYASGKRIVEVLDATPDIREHANPVVLKAVKGRVVFENVCFSYARKCEEAVLTWINFTAEPGETVAVIGGTGSGKTSLVQLIPRFYDVCNVCSHAAAGKITLDGVDVRKISLRQLRSIVGIVFQEAFLFGGTVQENIRFGNPIASDEEMIAAVKTAQAHDFILNLPQGYDTVVGQRGVTLSGGQKQRLNIARTLLSHPKILILDDSTSSVDVETDAKIHDALRERMTDCTTFIIAQRVSTVLTADKIIVLERGKIVAEGHHDQLLKTSRIYREIYESQLGNGGPNYE
jgi:ATP-binding cassette subfamily B protein